MPTNPPRPPDDASPGGDPAFDFAPRRTQPRRSRNNAEKQRQPDTLRARSFVERWVVDMLGEEEAAEFLKIPARFRENLQASLRNSPPFTASLILHLAVLILLALYFVRIDRKERQPIEVSFAATPVVETEQPGVQIVEPEPEPEPQPEVMSEQPPVEDPAAAPDAVEAEQAAAAGSEPAAAAAPAIGSLLDGRQAGRREGLVGAYGGSQVTEDAVVNALAWLVRQQKKDGLWSLQGPYEDGASQENRLAATAMALLALQGAGNTPKEGVHKQAVARAWAALLKKQLQGDDGETLDERRRTGQGSFEIGPQDPPDRQAMYSHGQVTIALCELYGMTKNPAYERPARQALAYALACQGRNGGWRYEPGQDGDMSVTGWYMMALKSAQMAGLEVPEETFENLRSFLDRHACDEGSRYGYRFEALTVPIDEGDEKLVRQAATPVTPAVSAEGLLCRQYLGWPRQHPAFDAGVDWLLEQKLFAWDTDKDVYAWYYITQVTHHLGGPAWERWNGRMKEVLPAEQVQKGREKGSWDPALDRWGPWGGRLFTTCFCTFMLEVYYRHLPIYGDAAVAH